jgi:hypothetical protein
MENIIVELIVYIAAHSEEGLSGKIDASEYV